MSSSTSSMMLCSFFFLLFFSGQSAAASHLRHRHHGKEFSLADFPTNFIFGVAASAYQVEGMALQGGRGPCIWDDFVKIPGNIPNNATADLTVDEYHRYKEDVDIMKRLNFDSYRFSISWSRIFPDGTPGRVNWEGVAYYNRLINYMLKKGITPYANLYHYDLPSALQDEYLGWLSPRVVPAFAEYADFCFKMFGDRVKNWFTFNEPRVVAALGYDSGEHAPGRCTDCTYGGNSAIEPYTVAHHLILSHAAAVNIYRAKYQKGRIGILLDFVWYEPHTYSEDCKAAAQRARDFHIGWFLHPLTYGHYPKSMQDIVQERLPKFTPEQVKMIKGAYDYVGVNQYTTYYMADNKDVNRTHISYSNDWHVAFYYDRNGTQIGPQAHSSWLYIVPWGMYKAITYVKEHYNNPTMLLSENGMDQPGEETLPAVLQDTVRVNYYKNYITELKRAIDDGANVVGYFAWSLLDNFEWRLGYTSRFGLVYVDWDTLDRYPKQSAYWFRSMLKRKKHGRPFLY